MAWKAGTELSCVHAGIQGSVVRCPGGCAHAQIWQRQLSDGVAVAFINLSSSTVDELCVSPAELQPFNADAVMVRLSCA